MSRNSIDETLDQIAHFSAGDRLLLNCLLAELGEAEWRSEVAKVREAAQRKGIDQETIDRAVNAERYGNRQSG